MLNLIYKLRMIDNLPKQEQNTTNPTEREVIIQWGNSYSFCCLYSMISLNLNVTIYNISVTFLCT